MTQMGGCDTHGKWQGALRTTASSAIGEPAEAKGWDPQHSCQTLCCKRCLSGGAAYLPAGPPNGEQGPKKLTMSLQEIYMTTVMLLTEHLSHGVQHMANQQVTATRYVSASRNSQLPSSQHLS